MQGKPKRPAFLAESACDSAKTWTSLVNGSSAKGGQTIGEKTVFLSHLYIKTIVLPRQARDKHRENSKKDYRFVAGTHHIDRVNATAKFVRLRLLEVLPAPVSPLISFRVLSIAN